MVPAITVRETPIAAVREEPIRAQAGTATIAAAGPAADRIDDRVWKAGSAVAGADPAATTARGVATTAIAAATGGAAAIGPTAVVRVCLLYTSPSPRD